MVYEQLTLLLMVTVAQFSAAQGTVVLVETPMTHTQVLQVGHWSITGHKNVS